ncbi:hypothetical protein SeMB42_g02331 [Synchytrium endobioticum]|uniref:Uncharacterized protein n=1 Tax=Synchytrium endobioticum TaxID=286115 RepID=A0A507DEV6_9FUNG|nr:hypothetical protein SeLEV6574_g03121 [Synchytrium endobioticum]TPX50222.1 hypothetical protein SeMB42_g02331 [Synchytrium endobioticum]
MSRRLRFKTSRDGDGDGDNDDDGHPRPRPKRRALNTHSLSPTPTLPSQVRYDITPPRNPSYPCHDDDSDHHDRHSQSLPRHVTQDEWVQRIQEELEAAGKNHIFHRDEYRTDCFYESLKPLRYRKPVEPRHTPPHPPPHPPSSNWGRQFWADTMSSKLKEEAAERERLARAQAKEARDLLERESRNKAHARDLEARQAAEKEARRKQASLKSYTEKWLLIKSTSKSCKTLRLADIPLPVYQHHELTNINVSVFLLSGITDLDTKRKRLREQLLLWHPDKSAGLVNLCVESERDAVRERINRVSSILTEINNSL